MVSRVNDAPAPPVPPSNDDTTGIIRQRSESIGLRLSGALPCFVCKYDLQGLSVRGVCPECGAAVRATILYAVDPHADAFQPLPNPRTNALGLLLWPGGALAAALLSWLPRVCDFIEKARSGFTLGLSRQSWLAPAILACALVSMAGAVMLVRVVRGSSQRFASVLSALAYGPLCWALWQLHAGLDRASGPPYIVAGPMAERIAYRLVIGASIAVIIFGLRPNARRLVARSLTLRTGRVDRQTLLGMALCVGVAAIGDGLRLASIGLSPSISGTVDDIGTITILAASVLLTLGFASAIVDGARIGRALVMPSPGYRQVFASAGSGEPKPAIGPS